MTNVCSDPELKIKELERKIRTLQCEVDFWRAEYEAAAPDDYAETCEANDIDPTIKDRQQGDTYDKAES